MNPVETSANTALAPQPLALGRPEQPVAAICDQFFAHHGDAAVRAVPAAPGVRGTRIQLSVGQLLGLLPEPA